MAISMKSLHKVRADKPPRIVAYGVQGIGKTSLAAEFPNPVFLQVEEGTPGDLELTSFGHLTSFADVMSALTALAAEEHDFGTVVIDTIDALEPHVWAQACADNGWKTIEEPGYGKGYVAAENVWREYLDALNAVRLKGVITLQLAHTQIEQFNSPVSDPYHRYHIKLHKRGSALIQEHADVVAFLNYQASLKQVDVGFNKKIAHAEGGGARMIHVEERPGYLAKNRYGMPAHIPYRKGQGFAAMAQYFPGSAAAVEAAE